MLRLECHPDFDPQIKVSCFENQKSEKKKQKFSQKTPADVSAAVVPDSDEGNDSMGFGLFDMVEDQPVVKSKKETTPKGQFLIYSWEILKCIFLLSVLE